MYAVMYTLWPVDSDYRVQERDMAKEIEYAHYPTDIQRALVRDFYASGVPQERIAIHLQIDVKTLRKHYREDLDYNLDGMVGKLGKNLYQDALAGNEKAREFWLRTRGRWSNAKDRDEEKDDKALSLLEQIRNKVL